MTAPESKTSYDITPVGDSTHKRIITWALAAAAAGAAGAGLWWLTKESYYSYVPIRYQYRPGTFTAWISRVLDSHAKRRRSEILFVCIDCCIVIHVACSSARFET